MILLFITLSAESKHFIECDKIENSLIVYGVEKDRDEEILICEQDWCKN